MNIIYQYMITGPDCDSRGPIEQIPDRSRSSVYREVADLSAHSFRKYANKLGCQHHYSKKQVITEGIEGNTVLLFEVLRIIYDDMYDEFDNLLFCDTDIICNTEEDIFALHVESGKEVSGICESSIFIGGDKGNQSYNSWDYQHSKFDAIAEKYKLNDIPIVTAEDMGAPHPSKVFTMNTGVHVWTKEARLRAREVFDDWLPYMESEGQDFWLNNDQPFISGQLAKYGFTINHLDQSWNDSPPHYGKWEEWKDQKFLHYTGGFGKKHLLDDYREGRFKYI